ncbi:conserved exported hypothetical protein [Candidatus Sulfopaludibacter sp. SbA6]|nr:conserved exported hypothetical protein [Candidatus Sulfopaludibacter sp. SbA6]
MKWLLGVAMLTSTLGRAGEVTVYIHNVVIAPGPVLVRAERMAAGMFARAGVCVRFRTDTPHTASDRAIEIGLDAHAPADRDPRVLAYAAPHERAGTRIHIFYNRVSSIHGGSMTAIVLGHVLAHEIAHVLEGVSRHSSTGVLKACWNEDDFTAMAAHPLRFAPEDVRLLQATR